MALSTISNSQNFHSLKINTINGEEFNFDQFKGKYVLVTNGASYCGYTSQYSDLQKLYEDYDNLVVLATPCNQFGRQEPGSADEIKTFCESKYKTTFPITEKIDVKGENQHVVYEWLTKKKFNQKDDYKVSWNFNKFLIDPTGKLISHFKSGVNPLSSEITQYLK